MNVAVILGLDGSNYFLTGIVKELNRRGHKLTFYGRSLESVNIQMFMEFADEIKGLDVLDDEIASGKISRFNCALCANDSTFHLLNTKLFIFTYSITTIFGTYLAEGGDLMFTTGIPCYERAIYEECAIVPVGNPKFDVVSKEISTDFKKQFLFVDSGHYPFGSEGKRVIAELMVKIAEAFPDFKLVIKPRFLENDTAVTHLNKNHIYKNIRDVCKGKIPKNLEMLDHYGNMQDLINESCTVICLYTSAYLDAVVQQRGLLIIDGIPSEDTLDMRNDFHWRIMRNDCGKTGCLVSYERVMDYLPQGLRVNEEAIADKLTYVGCTSAKAVDVIENVSDKIVNNLMPKARIYLNDTIQESDNYETLDWNTIWKRRKKNFLQYWFTRRIDAIDHRIDISDFENWLKKLSDSEEIQKKDINSLIEMTGNCLSECILQNRELLSESYINESYYMEEVLKTNPLMLIEECRKSSSNKRYVNYYYARALLAVHQGPKAVVPICDYLKETRNVEFLEFTSDRHLQSTFPFDKITRNSRIMIYGAGKIGKFMGEQLIETQYASLVAYIDMAKIGKLNSVDIIRPNEIMEQKVDYIVISIRDKTMNDNAYNTLRQRGISEKKILSYYRG